jgi:hypothetical protein
MAALDLVTYSNSAIPRRLWNVLPSGLLCSIDVIHYENRCEFDEVSLPLGKSNSGKLEKSQDASWKSESAIEHKKSR